MKPIDRPTRAKLFRDAKAALKHIADGKFDDAQKTTANMRKEVGQTAILMGVEAKAAWAQKNRRVNALKKAWNCQRREIWSSTGSLSSWGAR